MKKESDKKVLCPSSNCEEGAILLGIVNDKGQINFLKERFVIDNDFIEKAESDTTPESRFRFSKKCHKSGCAQWTGKECGVINDVIFLSTNLTPRKTLPQCSIRSQCRWYTQKGEEACKVCHYVITDTRDGVAG